MENQEKIIKVTPKDFFLNLGWLASLYGTIVAFIVLAFNLINYALPDVIDSYYSVANYASGVRGSISWLIVLFPIFLIVSHFLNKMIKIEPALHDLWIRKWLIYLTLFLSSVTLVVDLIITINKFLDGDLTSRFFAKAIVVFIVAGLTFYYYLKELKRAENSKLSKIMAWLAGLVIIGTIISSFFVIGFPKDQRKIKIDDERITDLQELSWQIENYYHAKNVLPLEDNWQETLKTELNYIVPIDPETKEDYVYKIVEPSTFKLCATFTTERLSSQTFDRNWTHGIGQECFNFPIKSNIDGGFKPVPIR